MSGNPMSPVERLRSALRCHGKAKRTGKPCQGPAVKGWNVCRVHGARGGAQRGEAHPNYRHGQRTIDAAETRREINELIEAAKELCNGI